METSMKFALGIDLGGSSVKAVAVTPEGQLLRERNVAFDPTVPKQWAERIRAVVQELETEFGVRSTCVGLSAPGLAAADERSIAYMPGRLEGLVGLDWTTFLGRADFVPVSNDAHAALLGEAWLGAARSYRHCILLTLGTGVGGAAMVDGQLLRGAVGRAGHFGHSSLDPNGPRDICRMPGSVETVIGNYNILERSQGRFPTTHALVAAHLAGDAFATEVWLKSVRALACAIGSFINIMDPEAVIVGGGIARAGDALFLPLREFVHDVEWMVTPEPVKIVPAELGELAGAFGAAWNALKHCRAG
jgi:glucokinase